MAESTRLFTVVPPKLFNARLNLFSRSYQFLRRMLSGLVCADPVSTGTFRAIQSRVGLLNQLNWIARVGGERRNADADRHMMFEMLTLSAAARRREHILI